MKLGTYTKNEGGFKVELISGDCEYALGTTEALMFTFRMGVDDEGMIMFLTIDEMQEFAQALRKSVDDMRAQMFSKVVSEALGKEFEF